MQIESLIQYKGEVMRHRLYFTHSEIQGIECVDIGLELSKEIEGFLNQSQLPMIASDKLDFLIDNHTVHVKDIGEVVVLRNISILFEPALKINVQAKFDIYSRGRTVVVQMEGSTINDGRLYLDYGRDRRMSVDLKHLTYKEIYDEI